MKIDADTYSFSPSCCGTLQAKRITLPPIEIPKPNLPLLLRILLRNSKRSLLRGRRPRQILPHTRPSRSVPRPKYSRIASHPRPKPIHIVPLLLLHLCCSLRVLRSRRAPRQLIRQSRFIFFKRVLISAKKPLDASETVNIAHT